ncbi:MAG TPA: long-chain fatty acid--CoA ligase [Intrasporangiaceae bacterium]|nr:long-chain fatty acid--CoA ligase [Intrasporangiaceae bacterium]
MTWQEVLAAAGYGDGTDLLRVPTSGTSGGTPRIVQRTVASWVDSFEPFAAATGITAADVVLAAGPPTSLFVYARAQSAWIGAASVVAARWDPRLLADATVAHLTPTMLADVLDQPARFRPSLRLAVVAGAALASGLRSAAQAAGIEVVEYYGAAELSFVALGRGVLRPFSGVEVESRDGVLWVRSRWTALGYEGDVAGPLRRDGSG